MTDQERLEATQQMIEERDEYMDPVTEDVDPGYYETVDRMNDLGHIDWLIKQAERVQELEKDVQEWQVVDAGWNEINTKIAEQNKRYKQALEDLKNTCATEGDRSNRRKYDHKTHPVDAVFENGKERAFRDVEALIDQALEGESE